MSARGQGFEVPDTRRDTVKHFLWRGLCPALRSLGEAVSLEEGSKEMVEVVRKQIVKTGALLFVARLIWSAAVKASVSTPQHLDRMR